jgi:transaldolase
MFLYADGPTFDEIDKLEVDGYTFNPSLYKKLGADNYIDFSKQIIKKIPKKPISIEVIGDNYNECLREAKVLSKLSDNIYVKIPIFFTNGSSTVKLINSLANENIKLNITAIFTIEQIKAILPTLKNSNSILSIFSGRIYDIGLDAAKKFSEMSTFIHDNSNCWSLWASCRMTYDYITAKKCSADIITMAPTLIDKMKLFKKNPLDYSKETVIGFYEDSLKAGYKI